ncbi:MAG: polysaccharide deacetylase [Firmicutes bacterium]|jgi:peptidoglycan/xylan/chitin deacetylase (PgdA/CDA1 family)|nr:polysaccharide deacetylase [Bacillota bacterium]
MLKDRITWPKGKKCAAMITVNLEAQYFVKLYYPDQDINMKEGEVAARGRECMEDGLPRLLDVLDEYGVRATFFILGAMADEYPEKVKEIGDRGHEIGCYGYYHENLATMTLEEQRKTLEAAKKRLEEATGKAVTAFRMPAGEMTEETLGLVKELGFTYSSSLSDNDIPYIRQSCGLMELPIHWELYDLPYFAYTFEPMIPQGQARTANANDVVENWMTELAGAQKFGALFNLQLDPQATGEQGKIFMLRRLLDAIKADGSVWLSCGDEIASYCEKMER